MLQLIDVILIIIISISYIAYRTYKAISEAESGCYGCKGCALKEQMIKNTNLTKSKTLLSTPNNAVIIGKRIHKHKTYERINIRKRGKIR